MIFKIIYEKLIRRKPLFDFVKIKSYILLYSVISTYIVYCVYLKILIIIFFKKSNYYIIFKIQITQS